MARSPGFGSTKDYFRPVQTWFPCGWHSSCLTLHPFVTRRFILQKARHHLSALTSCRHTVSESLSLRFRGSFHLSLTVLVHYRSPVVFSLGGWSRLLPTGFLVSCRTQDPDPISSRSTTGLSPSLAPLSIGFALAWFQLYLSYNPRSKSGLGFFPFARRY